MPNLTRQLFLTLLWITNVILASACAPVQNENLDAGALQKNDAGLILDSGILADAGLPSQKDPVALDIASWNMRFFPSLESTPQRAAEVILEQGWDFLAMQELYEAGAVDALLAALPEYEATVYPIPAGNSLSVGILWNKDVFELISTEPLTELAPETFSRTPVEIFLKVRNTSVTIRFISVHLTSGIEAAAEANRLLELAALESYIHADAAAGEHIVVLGDHNEAPTDPRYDEVFAPYFSQPELYSLLSKDLQTPQDATYLPASVILDQAMATLSLLPFIPAQKVDVVRLHESIPDYESVLSDHLPLHFSMAIPAN